MTSFFLEFPEILAVMSERADGSMRIAPGVDLTGNLANRKAFFERVGIDPDQVVAAGLSHGDKVAVIRSADVPVIPETDALVTETPGVFLSVTAADCLPIFLHEKNKRVIGIIHAGWRGAVGAVIEKTVAGILSLGGRAEDIRAAIGPAIGPCHFEIGPDILDRFSDHLERIMKKDRKTFADLKGIACDKMIRSGISEESIAISPVCTYCEQGFFSYRRDRPKETEAMVAVIGISPIAK